MGVIPHLSKQEYRLALCGAVLVNRVCIPGGGVALVTVILLRHRVCGVAVPICYAARLFYGYFYLFAIGVGDGVRTHTVKRLPRNTGCGV